MQLPTRFGAQVMLALAVAAQRLGVASGSSCPSARCCPSGAAVMPLARRWTLLWPLGNAGLRASCTTARGRCVKSWGFCVLWLCVASPGASVLQPPPYWG